MYLVFTRISGDIYDRRLRSLFCLCAVYRALVSSPVSMLILLYSCYAPCATCLNVINIRTISFHHCNNIVEFKPEQRIKLLLVCK